MSTKTTFKRVALVAVAALGLGVLTSAPSNAAPTLAYGIIADSASGQAVVGGYATVVVSLDTNTVTNIAVTGVGSVVAGTGSNATQTGTPTTGSWSESTTVGASSPTVTVRVTSAVAGVTTVSATPISVSGVPGTAVTKTVTWVAATTAGTYDHASAYISAGNLTARVGASDSTTAQLTFASTISTTPKATIAVTQFNAADTVTATTLASTGVKAITATITGAGAIGSTQDGSNAGASVTVAATSATAEDFLYVYSDGRNGTGTITVSVNGVAVATKTVNFYGTIASYVQDATDSLSKKYIGVATTAGADVESATVLIKGKDAAGVVQAAGTIYATTDTASIATVTVSGQTLYIYGVGVGTTNVNVCNTSACTLATVKYSFPITVTKKTAASVVLTFDKTSYAAGEKITWKVTAKDSAGNPIADGDRAVFGTVSANMSVVGTLPTSTVTFVDGVGTDFFYAPAASGKLEITTAEGADTDSLIAGNLAAAASNTTYTAKKTTVSATLVNDAIEAANAATTAALAANDAVDALAATVAKLVANLKAQITALTKLIVKIQKKVGA